MRGDLGDVHECAEIWINGRLAGTRIWPPYRVDVTEFLRPGENEMRIVVSNLMAIATKFRRMRGIVRFAGKEIEICDGLQALATMGKDGTFEIHGDELKCTTR